MTEETVVAFDVANASMDELVAKHNELNPSKPVDGFKTLKAARAAVTELIEKVANGETEAEATTTEGGAVEGTVVKNTGSAVRGPVQGVGKRAKELIAAGLDNKAVLAKVLGEFPNAKTSYACIAYYRNAMKKAKPVAVAEASTAEAIAETATETEAAVAAE